MLRERLHDRVAHGRRVHDCADHGPDSDRLSAGRRADQELHGAQAGLLHGHAVSIGMGLGAFLSFRKGWLEERMLKRILHLISKYELSLWNDILLDEKLIWAAQKSVIDKRGGNLVAPVPKGKIGVCGYINELSREELASSIQDYREICMAYDRNGEGIEPLCVDVGLEEPSEASKLATPTVAA